MAITDVAQAQDQVQAQAPTAAAATKKNSTSEAFKESGAAYRATHPEEREIEGTKSDKVAFVAALGNPNKKQDRKEKNEYVPSYVVVGYKFKLLEDMTVPNSPYPENYTGMLDTEAITEVPHKAGEIVALNLVETAAFLSRPEFAGKISGDGDVVTLSVRVSSDAQKHLPVLNKAVGSIKSNMELVAEMVVGPEGGKGTPVVKPEFAEKFGPMFKKRSATKSKGVSKASGEASSNIAAAFRQLYASKMA